MASKTPQTEKRMKRRTGVIVVAMLTLFLGELLLYTWCRVECVQTGYVITVERRKQKELQLLQNSLKIELAHLKAPEHVSRVARERLALAVPEPGQIVVVPPYED